MVRDFLCIESLILYFLILAWVFWCYEMECTCKCAAENQLGDRADLVVNVHTLKNTMRALRCNLMLRLVGALSTGCTPLGQFMFAFVDWYSTRFNAQSVTIRRVFVDQVVVRVWRIRNWAFTRKGEDATVTTLITTRLVGGLVFRFDICWCEYVVR